METKIFSNLLSEYNLLLDELNINDKLFKLGEIFSYYKSSEKDDKQEYIYSDINELNVSVSNNLTEIDISSALPTVCNVLFKEHTSFLNKLNSFQKKEDKNIYATNYIKKIENDRNLLIEIQNYMKLTVFSHVLNNYENVKIFEFKKDSILFKGKKKRICFNYKINQLIQSSGFKFHLLEFDKYFRFSNTSIYYQNNILIFKGKFKNPSEFICKLFLNIIKKQDINEEEIIDKYNHSFYKLSKNTQTFNYYFKFNNKPIDYKLILNELIIPFIYLNKIDF